jgi:hypothetical protein
MDATYSVPVSLSTISGGKLEGEFQKALAKMAELKKGEKMTISATITVQRLEDSDMFAEISYALSQKMPAPSKKKSLVLYNADFAMFTEEPPKPATVTQLSAFSAKRGGKE